MAIRLTQSGGETMAQNAYIKFVEGSAVASLTLDELKEHLQRYREQTIRTGQQLSWGYGEVAFPYTIENHPDADGRWFYLKGTSPLYRAIAFGVDREETEDGQQRHYVQVVLPDNATHGDKAKGNEFCKYLGRHYKAEVHLFNGRIMYFNPRK